MNREMLKEAIAEAKTIKETAIASAKAALEEAFTPQLTAMFAERLNEMEKMEEEVTEEMQDENYGEDKLEEFNLEEILAELGEGEDDDMDDMDMDGMEMPDNDQLEMMIKNILDQEIKAAIEAGEIEAGDNYEEKDEEMSDDEEVIDDEEEVSIEELLAEIDSLSEKDEQEESVVKESTLEAVDQFLASATAGSFAAAAAAIGTTVATAKALWDIIKGGKDNDNEMEETITELRSELNEVNLLNAKLLYTNKIFKAKNLTESEKVKVLNTFDKAETVKEVKLVFETLTESFKTTVKKNPIKESLGSASRTVTAAPKQEQIIEVNDAFARMQRLAGLRK